MSHETFQIISPVDGSVYRELPLSSEAEVERILDAARAAQPAWRSTPLSDRAAVLERFVEIITGQAAEAAEELTWQMGRPIKDSPGELRGFEERARAMIQLAPQALEHIQVPARDGFHRFVRREPLGVVLVIAAWNYPYLIATNGVVPALLAGNAVILKHSAQTPLVAERFAAALREAGLPQGLFGVLHVSHEVTARVVADRRVDYVNFTGSVEGGRAVHEAAGKRFITMGLELGGKDPAYVRPDANFDNTVATLVDGAFYNAGQSCCGIERIYVHQDLYGKFVEAYVALARQYVLGDPTDLSTTLGPLVRAKAADFVRQQIAKAQAQGAKLHINAAAYERDAPGTPYLAPQVLTDVTHAMDIMREETFGPAVGIMPVRDDEEAIRLMNDSKFGLSASVWTQDEEAALAIGDRIDTGTWFMNRCDYLDPYLAWVGVKDSGRGCTLSAVGYEVLTRPKSFHLKLG